VDAPPDAIAHLVALLRTSSDVPARVQIEPGTIASVVDVHRDNAAASNAIGGALLALARSSQPEALEAIEAWFNRVPAETGDEGAELLRAAGFDVDSEGTVYQMHSDSAFLLKPATERTGLLSKTFRALRGSDPPTAVLWGVADATCKACNAVLMSVLRVRTSAAPDILEEEDAVEITVLTCRNCVALDLNPYFVRLVPGPESLVPEDLPADFEPELGHDRVSPEPLAMALAPAATRLNYLFADVPELTRVGGTPSWVQGPEVIVCPGCDTMMPFVAQATDPPDAPWSGDTGMLYAFFCERCQIVATLTQCA
jgi:hypothetical protein